MPKLHEEFEKALKCLPQEESPAECARYVLGTCDVYGLDYKDVHDAATILAEIRRLRVCGNLDFQDDNLQQMFKGE